MKTKTKKDVRQGVKYVTPLNDYLFIEGNVPSLKNSKIKTSRGVFPSKTVAKYLRELGIASYSASRKEVIDYKTRPNLFRPYMAILANMLLDKNPPYTMQFHFVRKTKAKADFNNLTQILLDLFNAFDVIPDDNMDFILPEVLWIDNRQYTVDPLNPGVFINIKEDRVENE